MVASSVITPPATQRAQETTPRPRIGPPWVIALLLVAYFGTTLLIAAASIGPNSCDNDYGGVFQPSARFVLAGRPLDMYLVRAGGGTNLLYPNATGPVGELVMAAVLAPGRALGLQHVPPLCTNSDPYPVPGDSVPLRLWVIVLFSIIPLLISAELLRLMDRWQAQPLTGWQRGLIWLLILLSPPTWDSLIYYGHFEQLIAVYLSLLAVRAFMGRKDTAGQITGQQFAVSGLLLGLALLSRTSTVFVAIPLGLVLLFERRWWAAARYVATGVATVAVILLPFYLHDRKDLVFSLTGFRAALGIGDGSFWTFFKGLPSEHTVQPLDSTVALIGAVVVSVALIWLGRVRSADAALLAVICAASLWFPLSIKAVWGYYFADPLIWGLAWAVTRPVLRTRWWEPIFITACFTALMVITEYRVTIVTNADYYELGTTRTLVLIESGTEFVVLLLFLLVLFVGVLFTRRAPTAVEATTPAASYLPPRAIT